MTPPHPAPPSSFILFLLFPLSHIVHLFSLHGTPSYFVFFSDRPAPTLPVDGPCVVRVNIYLRSISKIDDLSMEYTVQMTFREQWRDERLQYDDLGGQVRYLTLTEPDKLWKPDLFFSNEKEGHFHNIIMPNVLLRIHPNGDVLFSIRQENMMFGAARMCCAQLCAGP
ncbi:hypothetical protein HPB48_012376 [Haemaphysalis longicornis]|uniref:Neurotransmitter-gated ion-channel ligand-binding domain-containing protein n=1 Tax=Haemaphysalis longicornis TaxID=44386 RepID=A0A9J6G4D4_HAELO|nr:hypothetical protein HPB48_012376 [Haemaphysalis longicornis]